MDWLTLNFGKYKGKSLPQVLFTDPDWFFWAIEKKAFKGKGTMEKEAQELNIKARSIRIPQKEGEKRVVWYVIDPTDRKFVNMELVPETWTRRGRSMEILKGNVIDLSIPRQIAHYDKLGCRILIDFVKSYLFESSEVRMTKKKCEDFFSDDNNFDL